MIITEAQYAKDNDENNVCIIAIIDGTQFAVPLDPANRHYQAIQEWAKIEGNKIEDAD